MKRSVFETLLGAFVICLALGFLVFGYTKGGVATPEGYRLTAEFSAIGGLKAGDEVQVGGVKVGSVTDIELLPETFLARVHMDVDRHLKLPVDTAAIISSESLLGGRYLLLQPGAEEDVIPEGGQVKYTQAPQNLEQLLGQFIFSVSDKKNEKTAENAETAPPPGTMPEYQVPVAPAVAPNAQPVPAPAPELTPAAPAASE